MPTDIYFISNVVNWFTNLLALAIGVFYCYRAANPTYLRVFPGYLLVSIAIEVFVNRYLLHILNFEPFSAHQLYAKTAIYNLFTPFELYMFSWFLFQVIKSARVKKVLIVSLWLFSLFFIIYSLKTGLGEKNNVIGVVLESIVIMIPCMTYYRELFTRSEPVDLLREPSFWMVTGIFFYLASIIPFYVTSSYLLNHGLAGAAKSLSSINNFALVITYFLFIKGFTCRIKKS